MLVWSIRTKFSLFWSTEAKKRTLICNFSMTEFSEKHDWLSRDILGYHPSLPCDNSVVGSIHKSWLRISTFFPLLDLPYMTLFTPKYAIDYSRFNYMVHNDLWMLQITVLRTKMLDVLIENNSKLCKSKD